MMMVSTHAITCMLLVHISHPHLSLFSSPVVTVVFERPSYTVLELVDDIRVCLRKDLETAVPFQVDTFTDDRSAMSKCSIDACALALLNSKVMTGVTIQCLQYSSFIVMLYHCLN